jgi:hypothetical protein
MNFCVVVGVEYDLVPRMQRLISDLLAEKKGLEEQLVCPRFHFVGLASVMD